MIRSKEKTQRKILLVAKKEFLSKGYEKASLRKIAENVGISATAIYRHYENKETLFNCLVEPDLNGMFATHAKHDDELMRLLKSKDPSEIWKLSEFEFMESLHYVYNHYDSFKLLLCCAEGTRLHEFQHDLVEEQVKRLLEMHQIAKEHGIQVNPITAQELHLIISGFFSSLFEMVIHDYDKEDAMKCGMALAKYFNAGISAVLGI